MDRRILKSAAGAARGSEQGFTLIETMVAMSISIIALLANLYLFNTAQRNLTLSRSVTNATNLATGTLAVLKSRPIAQINDTTNHVASGFTIGTHTDDPDVLPLEPSDPSDLVKRQRVDGTVYSRTWTVSNIDIDGDGTPDLVGDLVKVSLAVTWTLAGSGHRVAMTTFTTGQAP